MNLQFRRQLKNYQFAVVQLASAFAAFGAWAVLSLTAPSEVQVVPVRALTVAAPLSLCLFLGTTYLLPNMWRGSTGHRGVGPWSPVVALSLVVASASLAVSATAPLRSLLVATTGAMATTFALGILLSQVGRIQQSLSIALVGAAAPSIPPALWAASALLGGDSDGATWALIACACVYLATAGAVLRRPTGWTTTRSLRGTGGTIGSALSLLPHLLFFGALVQGARLLASFSGAAPDVLLTSHYLMLCTSIGLTFLASMNGVLTVTIQTADSLSDALLRRVTTSYAVTLTAAALLTLTSTSALLAIDGTFTLVDAATSALLACATALVGFFYSLSSQLMRDRHTVTLSFSSGAAAGLLFACSFIPTATADLTLYVSFAASTALLPAVALALSVLNRRARRPNVRAVWGLLAVAALCVGLVGATALLRS